MVPRARPKNSRAFVLRHPVRVRPVRPPEVRSRDARCAAVSPEPPTACRTALWIACAAQGTQAPEKPIIAFRSFEPESVVADETSWSSTPKNESRLATHERMFL